MKEITHVNATTIAEATSALGANAAVIAGGTDILGQLKSMISPNAPGTLVNIKTISGLDEIKEEGGVLKIGALTRLTDIAESATVLSKYAALAEAARRVASPELRNMGTIGGNICQFIRCWYYRAEFNAFPCLRKNPSGICYALVGDNRYNSIFGTLEGCVAVNPSDTAPALVALDAKVATSKNTTGYDAEDFFAFNGEKTTSLLTFRLLTALPL
jgi:xanthine dehydrogenase YagS FAD-binding subunit